MAFLPTLQHHLATTLHVFCFPSLFFIISSHTRHEEFLTTTIQSPSPTASFTTAKECYRQRTGFRLPENIAHSFHWSYHRGANSVPTYLAVVILLSLPARNHPLELISQSPQVESGSLLWEPLERPRHPLKIFASILVSLQIAIAVHVLARAVAVLLQVPEEYVDGNAAIARLGLSCVGLRGSQKVSVTLFRNCMQWTNTRALPKMLV